LLASDLEDAVQRGASLQETLDLISESSDSEGQELIRLIKERRFYKRVLTLHDERPLEEGAEPELDAFRRASSKPQFRKRLRELVAERFAGVTAAKSGSNLSALSTERVNTTAEGLSKSTALLVDAPDPQYGSRTPLRIIPEPKRLERNYLTRAETGERVSEVWAQVHHRLMRFAAKGRVFCHPDLRDTVVAAIGPEDLRGLVREAISSAPPG
jgi:hypothetical protein